MQPAFSMSSTPVRNAVVLTLFAATLAAVGGCRTNPYGEMQWEDLSGRKRDHAALEADYENCRAGRAQAVLEAQSAADSRPDWVAQGRSDTEFLRCMVRSGWQPMGAGKS